MAADTLTVTWTRRADGRAGASPLPDMIEVLTLERDERRTKRVALGFARKFLPL